MPPWLSPLAVAVLVYLPGLAVRGLVPSDDRGESGLFEDIFLGVVLVSTLGLLLAEFAVFGLGNLLIVLSIGSLLAVWYAGRPVIRYKGSDGAGLAIALAAAVWLAPPFHTLLYGSDSTVYEAAGIHLARTGTLIFSDPTIAKLAPAQQLWLLPSLASDQVSPPYLRLPGGFTAIDRASGAVLPAFHHLYMVWTALFVSLSGLDGAPWANLFFAALSNWAIYRFTSQLVPCWAALFAIALLNTFTPQYWYSRFPMPELATQYALWAALGSSVEWLRRHARHAAILSALGFGLAGLLRIEQPPLLLAPLLVALASAGSTPGRQRAAFVVVIAALWLWAGLHVVLLPTHYSAVFRNALPAHTGTVAVATAALLALAGSIVVRVWQRPAQRNRMLIAAASLVAAGDLALLILHGEWRVARNVGYLTTYVGEPALLVAIVGVLLVATRRELVFFVATVALGAVHTLADPHAQPVPLWIGRRFVPILLPALAVFTAAVLARAAQARHYLVLALLIATASVFVPAVRLLPWLRRPVYPPAATHLLRVTALLEPGAVILAERSTTLPSQILASLWGLGDAVPYLLDASDMAAAPALVRSLSGTPMYWLSLSEHPVPTALRPFVHPIGTYAFSFPAATFERYRYEAAILSPTAISLYRLVADENKRGPTSVADRPPL
jgi:hypothetical protein